MNKDVIYIEPEDDITDIINKIEKAKPKIVALVPPKKAGILRSLVNIKLIAKAATNAAKSVVIVTTDPSILKLAAATKLPVTKDLQTAPAVPKIGPEDEVTSEKETVETPEDAEEETTEEGPEESEDEAAEADGEEEKEGEDGKKNKKAKNKKVSKNKFLNWVREHKKLSIIGGIGGLALIAVLIWALFIAPAAIITVGIRTTNNNFSKNVSFVENLADENAGEGKFYLEQAKIETKAEVKFTATGEKNVGEKAHGSVIVYKYVSERGGSVVINAGEVFSHGELSYAADEGLELHYDGGPDASVCDNAEVSVNTFKRDGCLLSGKVSVTAVAPGKKYNIEASDTGWSAASISVYSNESMTGGTDNMITVVQQSDIDKAIGELQNSSSAEVNNKEKLFDELPEDAFVIDSTYEQRVGDVVSTPNIGEEVKSGEQATLSVTTTDSVYFIDKIKVEEFIRTEAKLAENFKIYSINDPFVENFTKTEGGYTGKLKTSYISGPKVTENDIIDIVKGKGTGTAQHDLKDIEGISSIRIDTSYPWVTSIPNDANKITVILDVEGQ